jgi:hypothetical protein
VNTVETTHEHARDEATRCGVPASPLRRYRLGPLEIHDIEVDEAVAGQHWRGTLHLPCGRVCQLRQSATAADASSPRGRRDSTAGAIARPPPAQLPVPRRALDYLGAAIVAANVLTS